MANKTNCPNCGKTNVKGRLTNSSVPGFTLTGSLAGLYLGPIGPLVGAPIGAGIGKLVNHIAFAMGAKKSYKFKCPRCGEEWNEE